LSAFVAGLVLYFGVWDPAIRFRDARLAERDRNVEMITYMRQTEAKARSVRNQRPRTSGQPLLSTISQIAQQNTLTPSRLQPEGEQGVSAWFDAVPFNTLIRFLEMLEFREGIIIRQITVDREDDPGVVRARIVLGS